jgi:hypothetical protein
MKFFALILALAFSFSAAASDLDDIKACLHYWGKTPFSKESPEFRVVSSKVKVMGIGDDFVDSNKTAKPDLVLLKPAVTVMAKSVMSLLNPNGWYCIKGKVDVLGKGEINVACKAHLATSRDGTTVMGSNDAETGVTVLGKSTITRVGCAKE